MSNTISMRGLAIVLFTIAVLFIGIAPSFASADAIVSQTAQLLPPGPSTCIPASVTGFTPYVYNGALHSFEFTVSDNSYVPIAGSVGNMGVPFNQMTRINAGGPLRVHVDVATTPVGNGLPLSVTMLSARGGPVCITMVGATVSGVGQPYVSRPLPAPSPVSPITGTTAPKPKPAPTPAPVAKPAPSPAPSAGAATTATSAMFATTQNILKDICAGAGADRLWFILLAIFVAIVAFAVFGQSQLPPAMRTQEWTAAAIVVPFLLLFGLWYFAESCRTSPWVPVIATIIALAGLAIAFWERGTKGPQTAQTIINLPPSAKR